VVAFGQILRKPIRDVPELGCLNLHFSLLPRWRGAAPVQQAVLAGDTETGVCVQRLVARLDEGAVLAMEREPVAARDTTSALRERLVAKGAPLLRDVVQRLLAGEELRESAQDESSVTYAPKIDREAGQLDFTAESAPELDRRIRAFGEWPGAHAVLQRATGALVPLIVHTAAAESGAGEPGRVLSADADGLVVAAREGCLRITRLQKHGKRVLDVRDFLNGCPVTAGDRLLPR
jgi:methionyl-tRNA formyltransferase